MTSRTGHHHVVSTENDEAGTVEWPLADGRGRLVRVEPITGEARGNTGNVIACRGNFAVQVKAVPEDLLRRSHRAIASSPEIRRLAGGAGGRT